MTIGKFGGGHELLTFIPCDKPVLPEHDADVPMTWAVVVVQCDGRYLLLFDRNRRQWEIPGGGIEAGEHPDAAARREVLEETSQLVQRLICQGVFKVRLQPDGRYEYGVLYTGTIGEVLPFRENEESERIRLWNPREELDGNLSILSQMMMDLAEDRRTL